MTAMDQRGSLAELMAPGKADSVRYAQLKSVKLELAATFGPLSSAVLLDPLYGAAEAIAYGALPGRTGLLVAWEESGYTSDGSGRLTRVEQGWSVEKIKLMGASAVKLLVYYHPDEPQSREHAASHRQASGGGVPDVRHTSGRGGGFLWHQRHAGWYCGVCSGQTGPGDPHRPRPLSAWLRRFQGRVSGGPQLCAR